MARTDVRTIEYEELVRTVRAYYRARNQYVDFRINAGGAIVGAYRVRDFDAPTWTDLLPVGTYGPKYRAVVQKLVPALFGDEPVTIASIIRRQNTVTITVEAAEDAAAEMNETGTAAP